MSKIADGVKKGVREVTFFSILSFMVMLMLSPIIALVFGAAGMLMPIVAGLYLWVVAGATFMGGGKDE